MNHVECVKEIEGSGYQYLCQPEWWCGVGQVQIGKCSQVKVTGESVFMDHVECVQEIEGCGNRVLRDFFYHYEI